MMTTQVDGHQRCKWLFVICWSVLATLMSLGLGNIGWIAVGHSLLAAERKTVIRAYEKAGLYSDDLVLSVEKETVNPRSGHPIETTSAMMVIPLSKVKQGAALESYEIHADDELRESALGNLKIVRVFLDEKNDHAPLLCADVQSQNSQNPYLLVGKSKTDNRERQFRLCGGSENYRTIFSEELETSNVNEESNVNWLGYPAVPLGTVFEVVLIALAIPLVTIFLVYALTSTSFD